MGLISEETIRSVMEATDIVQVIGRSVQLRRLGGAYRGLCPFHQEKTPSFYVNPSRNTYHCFGCGAGGTVVRYIMEYDRLTFPEAVKKLGEAAGIAMEEEAWDPDSALKSKLRSQLLLLHKASAEWFHALLMKQPAARESRSYLKSRGLDSGIARQWMLGWCPESAEELMDWGRANKFSSELLQRAGLIIMPEEANRRVYSRFRNRLMFPVRNDQGEVIAFSGRILEADAKAAKYLNSPETMLFSKSRTLYGFDKTRRAILKEKTAIVCEGQLDLISCHERGVENVVAPLGTALTNDHANILKRHCDDVILCFDSDAAGHKAAERAYEILTPAGLHVRVATLPAGEDPDSLLRQKGVEAFRECLQKSEPFFDHQINHYSIQFDRSSLRDRMRLAEILANAVRFIESPVARDAAVNNVATRLEVSAGEFRKLVAEADRQALPSQRAKAANFHSAEEQEERESEADALHSPAACPPNSIKPALRLLYQLVISDGEVLPWLRKQSKTLLDNLLGTELLAKLIELEWNPNDSASVGVTMMKLHPKEAAWISGLMAGPSPGGGLEAAKLAWQELQGDYLRMRIATIQAKLKQPQLDHDSLMDLLQENSQLQKDSLALLEIKSRLRKFNGYEG